MLKQFRLACSIDLFNFNFNNIIGSAFFEKVIQLIAWIYLIRWKEIRLQMTDIFLAS